MYNIWLNFLIFNFILCCFVKYYDDLLKNYVKLLNNNVDIIYDYVDLLYFYINLLENFMLFRCYKLGVKIFKCWFF